MAKISKRVLAGILSCTLAYGTFGSCGGAGSLTIGSLPVYAAENTSLGSVNPDKVNSTINSIIKGFADMMKEDQKSALQTSLSHMSGFTTLTGAGFAILQITGVLKDGTSQKLAAISEKLNIVMSQLDSVNKEIKTVQQSLHDMQSTDVITTRNTTADAAMSRWQIECLQNHLQALANKRDDYALRIYNAVNAWTNSSSKNDLDVNLTDKYDQVWVNDGTSLDGKEISYSVTLPKSVVEQFVPVETLKQDSYTDALISQLAEAIYDAAAKGYDEKEMASYKERQTKLDANAEKFKKDYDSTYEEVISKYETIDKEIKSLEDELSHFVIYPLRNQIDEDQKEYDSIKVQVDVDTANTAVATAQAVLDRYNAAISEYEGTPEDQRTESMKSAYEEAQANLSNAQNDLAKAIAELTQAARKAELKASIDKNQKQLNENIARLDILEPQYCDKVYEKNQLQATYDQASKLAVEAKRINDGVSKIEARDHAAPESLVADKLFYCNWGHSTEEENREKATKIATAMANSFIYDKACETMSSNDGRQFISDYRQAYNSACEAILDLDKIGLKNFWTALTNMYTFEGQAEGVFNNTMDFLIRSLGIGGSFMISMEAQDNSLSNQMIQKDIDHWTDVVSKLQTFKDSSLTGHKNYCYLTNSVLKYRKVTMQMTSSFRTHYVVSSVTGEFRRFGFDKETTSPMSIIVNDAAELKDKKSVGETTLGALSLLSGGNPEKFLKDNGVVEDYTKYVGEIAYDIGDVTGFKLSDEVNLTCHSAGEKFHGNRFQDKKVYNHLKYTDEGWYHATNITGSTIDLSNNAVNKNKRLATTIVYAVTKSGWNTDEAELFTNMDVERTVDNAWIGGAYSEHWCDETFNLSKTYGFIESVKV